MGKFQKKHKKTEGNIRKHKGSWGGEGPSPCILFSCDFQMTVSTKSDPCGGRIRTNPIKIRSRLYWEGILGPKRGRRPQNTFPVQSGPYFYRVCPVPSTVILLIMTFLFENYYDYYLIFVNHYNYLHG